jgi:hypothetical protein
VSDVVQKFFKVAEHVFSVGGRFAETCGELMGNYAPFAIDGGDGETLFSLVVETDGSAPAYAEEIRQDEEGQVIICGHTAAGESVFEYILRGVTAGTLVCSTDYRQSTLFLPSSNKEPRLQKYALDNALMVLYALAAAPYGTVLFHAAVVSCQDKGYMFLGKSGTGKSTHARLWLQHVVGSELMNDDNPVVRFFNDVDGKPCARVYGSPWSGKTPCYRNVEAPLGGIVLLSQAPYNKIVRLRGVQAYAALVTSISGKRWDKRIADGLHATENALAGKVPVWHLECLPDEAAARLCCASVVKPSTSLDPSCLRTQDDDVLTGGGL